MCAVDCVPDFVETFYFAVLLRARMLCVLCVWDVRSILGGKELVSFSFSRALLIRHGMCAPSHRKDQCAHCSSAVHSDMHVYKYVVTRDYPFPTAATTATMVAGMGDDYVEYECVTQ